MPDDLTVTAAEVNESPVLKDRLALAREAARQKAESHDIHTCLCPYCKGRRKRAGIPQPISKPKTKPAPQPQQAQQPESAPAPTNINPKDIIHDRENCPCAPCKEWRTERARLAANARYAKERAEQYDWENQPLLEAEQHLADMRREIERGAKLLHQRFSTSRDPDVPCINCGARIPNGRWVMQKSVRDDATGLTKPVFFCSGGCVNLYSNKQLSAQHGPTTGEPTGRHPEQSAKARADKAFATANPVTVS